MGGGGSMQQGKMHLQEDKTLPNVDKIRTWCSEIARTKPKRLNRNVLTCLQIY